MRYKFAYLMKKTDDFFAHFARTARAFLVVTRSLMEFANASYRQL